MDRSQLLELRTRAKQGLDDVLDFFADHAFDPNGGFWGRVDRDLKPDRAHQRSLVLGARLLWTYAAAYRVLGNPRDLDLAKKTLAYLQEHFIDPEYGGGYWGVNPDGTPYDTSKYPYGQAFLIYGGSELYRACGEESALRMAQDICRLLDDKARDPVYDGYYECYDRKWVRTEDSFNIPDPALGVKALNTHLHLIESYSNLYRAAPEAWLKNRVRALIGIMTDRLLDREVYHYKPYMQDDWSHSRSLYSFGHDIEAGWLLTESAEIYGDHALFEECIPVALSITDACERGLSPQGGMYAEQFATGETDIRLHWWVQAESVVGFFNAWQLSGEDKYLRSALRVWDFIDNHVVDRGNGYFCEWRCDASLPLSHELNRYPINAWKTPYHNARMYLELIERIDKMLQ